MEYWEMAIWGALAFALLGFGIWYFSPSEQYHSEWLGCCHVVNGTGGAGYLATGTCIDSFQYWDGENASSLDTAYKIAEERGLKCWLN